MENLIHFSRKPLKFLRDGNPRGWMLLKPNGLWLSVGPAWLEWCVAENFALERFRYATPVSIAKNANILRIETAAALDTFTDTYGQAKDIGAGTLYYKAEGIDWVRVMAEFDGIIISPYQWERRQSLLWYCSWDVASGCVWRARAMAIQAPSFRITPKSLESLAI